MELTIKLGTYIYFYFSVCKNCNVEGAMLAICQIGVYIFFTHFFAYEYCSVKIIILANGQAICI